MMAATAAQLAPATGLSPEDLGRADVYALLAALFYAPPSQELLKMIAQGTPDGEPDSDLAIAWSALRDAAGRADPAAVQQECHDLFYSPGRPLVMVYASYHRAGFLMDTPLVDLREHLALLGFARREGVAEPEDHFSALCDVMRSLIMGGAESPAAPLSQQQEFFNRHIASWYRKFLAELAGCETAVFYRHAGRFAEAFLDVESSSFNIGR
jgi:TorA maturation chaperone TorD